MIIEKGVRRKSKLTIRASPKYLVVFLSIIMVFLGITSCSTTENKIPKNNQVIEKMVSRIKTDIDTNFIYNYKNSRFVPPADRILLIQGQSLNNINDYRAFSKYKNYPGGWSAYFAVTEFSGITESWTTVSGDTQNHQFLVDKFDNMVLHSAMWMVGKWGVANRVKTGSYDHVIRQYSKWAKTVNRPIYLRIGYEFDGPHNELEPFEYIDAYRRIVDIIRSEGVTNISFVWHSYASLTYKSYPISDWYPGDDYVDWVAISVFFQPYDDIFNHKETNDVINFAKAKKKPVMIAEANPVLGINEKEDKIWDDWFVDFFSFCYEKNIKAIAFINENWQRIDIEGIEDWKDARLYNNDLVWKAWFMETNKNRYLKQSSTLFSELGYSEE